MTIENALEARFGDSHLPVLCGIEDKTAETGKPAGIAADVKRLMSQLTPRWCPLCKWRNDDGSLSMATSRGVEFKKFCKRLMNSSGGHLESEDLGRMKAILLGDYKIGSDHRAIENV
ncbi:hypothetical protein AVEN_192154-1 [Araneus ventricosus]|uniref:Uncharacterized protein n=1 Tax=Araneus ventricosus TaxID=182803 RepID=A0A4Y2RXB7_ARAVE|nr:hypothetical protein AVEN_192154-1 [Araneus ventricosus]